MARSKGKQVLEHVPQHLKDLPGIGLVSTRSQLQRLCDFIAAKGTTPYIRLGCSVQHGEARKLNPPSSVWAVSIDGQVEVLHFVNKDPRSSWKWVSNPGRAWNIAAAFPKQTLRIGGATLGNAASSRCLHYIVTVNEADADAFPEMTENATALCRRRSFPDEVGVKELLVFGNPDWWTTEPYNSLMISVRQATGELFSGDSGSYWAYGSVCHRFKAYGFADLTITGQNGKLIGDPYQFVREQAEAYVLARVCPFSQVIPDFIVPTEIASMVALELEEANLASISLAELNNIAVRIRRRAALAARPMAGAQG